MNPTKCIIFFSPSIPHSLQQTPLLLPQSVYACMHVSLKSSKLVLVLMLVYGSVFSARHLVSLSLHVRIPHLSLTLFPFFQTYACLQPLCFNKIQCNFLTQRGKASFIIVTTHTHTLGQSLSRSSQENQKSRVGV